MAATRSLQARVLEFLGTPEAYPSPPATVERIETHASFVFLAGLFAYKVKRAVKYPFLDFSTLARRQAACLNELRVNARTAPQLYLEVVPITLDKGGAFRLGGEGETVEWVLRMHRFDQAKLYDRMASEGRLDLASMPRLAAVIQAFHASADRVLSPEQAVRPLVEVLRDNEAEFAAHADVLSAGPAIDLARASRDRLATLAPLLEARARGGYLRHCHGDLHLRNIVEIDGAPVLFDAIEFDDRLATIDVLYDLAFLLMDLGKRGLGAHANAVLNAYLEAEGGTGNLLGLAVLPLFLAMRATIRAKVEMLRARMAAGSRAEAVRDECARLFCAGARVPCADRAAPRRRRRFVGHGQIRRLARDRALARRLPGSRHCAQRCRAQAPVRCGARGKASGTRLRAGGLRPGLRHEPQARDDGDLRRAGGDRRCRAGET